jgi:hypothetical protein
MTMFIKMLETRRGCQDGWKVELFEEGNTYDVADSLAGQFFHDKSALRATVHEELNYQATAGRATDTGIGDRDFEQGNEEKEKP